MSLFPYFTFKTSTSNWHVTEYTTLFALGGRKADGVNSPTVYISLDQGITWKEADELAKLPMYIPSMAYSQAIVRKYSHRPLRFRQMAGNSAHRPAGMVDDCRQRSFKPRDSTHKRVGMPLCISIRRYRPLRQCM